MGVESTREHDVEGPVHGVNVSQLPFGWLGLCGTVRRKQSCRMTRDFYHGWYSNKSQRTSPCRFAERFGIDGATTCAKKTKLDGTVRQSEIV